MIMGVIVLGVKTKIPKAIQRLDPQIMIETETLLIIFCKVFPNVKEFVYSNNCLNIDRFSD